MNAAIPVLTFGQRASRLAALVRREVRDQMRDWRVVIPIVILTLFFPFLMNFTASVVLDYVNRYGGNVVAQAVFPFLLMIVGFFPTSVSLVIALESFVGEKERYSLEPLLATPLGDSELFLGKVVASILTPLASAGLGIIVYLTGMLILAGWFPPVELLLQIIVLTIAHAVCMVSAAVVISAQTNSVRAANLLASFIIVPAALLVQGESIVMFFRMYRELWWVILGVIVLAVIFIRIGLRQFRREELLSREVEEIHFGRTLSLFRRSLTGGARNPVAWYRQAVVPALRRTLPAGRWAFLALLLGAGVGLYLAGRFPFPVTRLDSSTYRTNFLQSLGSLGFFSAGGMLAIFLHNMEVYMLAGVLGVISLGVVGLVILMLPMAVLAYAAIPMAGAGLSPLLYVVGFILPHGIVELPTIWLAGAAILHWGSCLLAKPDGHTIGELWIQATGDFLVVMVGVVLPMALLSAALETWLTPLVAGWAMGLAGW
jgi:uncharacterized membrane protein SpoIIM required for sporulation/ABC-type transport system involved in multi-copper enzyme maturation permease subunit